MFYPYHHRSSVEDLKLKLQQKEHFQITVNTSVKIDL